MKRRSATLIFASAALLAAMGAQAQDKLPYNLKSGKPYDGTELRVLLVGTPQFKGLELRAEEFTKMTGIKVMWDETTFKALQEKVSSVGVAADGSYDVVNYLDSWGPPNARWLVDLGPLLKRDGISMDRYPSAFTKSVTYDGKVMGLPEDVTGALAGQVRVGRSRAVAVGAVASRAHRFRGLFCLGEVGRGRAAVGREGGQAAGQ